jgi:rSAM/selenodomain-associated transferase 2
MIGVAPGVTPQLSVVVPTWNEAGRLAGLVRSLEHQRVPLEWIVVDGGSSDGTADLARQLGARVVPARRGRGVQLAAGARLAQAELLTFLHADTWPGPGALDVVHRAFADPALEVAGMCQRIDHRAPFYRFVERAANRRVRSGWVYGDSGLTVRRATYEAVGGFREIALFEDLDLSARLRRRVRVALLREAELVVSARRWEREGRLRRTFSNWFLTGLWLAGVDPDRLARRYRSCPEELLSSNQTGGTR